MFGNVRKCYGKTCFLGKARKISLLLSIYFFLYQLKADANQDDYEL